MDYKYGIKRYLDLEMEVIKSLDLDAINSIMNEIKASQERGSIVYICGNGGSHATA